MAIVMLAGAELGTLAQQCISSSGTCSISTTQKRTGAYAFRTNPTAGTGTINITKLDASGRWAVLAGSHWVTFYMYVATLPGSTADVAYLGAINGGTSAAKLTLSSSGELKIVGTTTSATVATLATGTWYKIRFRAANGGTCGVAVDNGSETTVTGNAVTVNYFVMGTATASTTMDIYFDDIVIDSSTFIDGSVKVELMLPDGNGNYTGWTASTGQKWQTVDEIPVSETDYNDSGSGAGTIRYSCTLESASNAGITGTIHAVRIECWMGETASTTTSGGVGLRCGGTDAESGDLDIGGGGAGPTLVQWLRTTNPADSAAFEPSDLDGMEVIIRRASGDTSAIRAYSMGAEVAFTPSVSVTVTGISATATADGGVAVIAAVRIATIIGLAATATAAALFDVVAALRAVTVVGQSATATADGGIGDVDGPGSASVIGESAAASAAGGVGTVVAQRILVVIGESATALAAAGEGVVATVRAVVVVGATAVAVAEALEAVIAILTFRVAKLRAGRSISRRFQAAFSKAERPGRG